VGLRIRPSARREMRFAACSMDQRREESSPRHLAADLSSAELKPSIRVRARQRLLESGNALAARPFSPEAPPPLLLALDADLQRPGHRVGAGPGGKLKESAPGPSPRPLPAPHPRPPSQRGFNFPAPCGSSRQPGAEVHVVPAPR